MAMEGFLFKGAGESTEGFRQKKFDDDKAMQDRKFKREMGAWDMLNEGFNRTSREGIAKDQGNRDGRATSLGAAAQMAKMHNDAHDMLLTQMNTPGAQFSNKQRKQMQLQMSEHRRLADHYASQVASRSGLAPASAPQKSAYVDPIFAAIEKMSAGKLTKDTEVNVTKPAKVRDYSGY